jgi:RNA recognition motif-containing protein
MSPAATGAGSAAGAPRKKPLVYSNAPQANPTAYQSAMDNTNIYIRGLAPDTSDADLEALCSIYGRILSSKAIVDLKTGICKGFGFAMFETMDMASMALDGLSRQGFLVTFAVQGPRGDSVRLFLLSVYAQHSASAALY